MEKRLREKFLPLDYAQTLFYQFQNLKQTLSTVEELMNKFYQLSIHVDRQETDEQLAARYVNCLKFSIQDQLSMHTVRNVEEAYQLALKAKEKKNRQFLQRNRGTRRVHCLLRRVVLIMAEEKLLKELRKSKIVKKINPNPP